MHVRMCFPAETRLTVPGNPSPIIGRILDDGKDEAVGKFVGERYIDLGPWDPLAEQIVLLHTPRKVLDLIDRDVIRQYLAEDETVADVLSQQSPLSVPAA